ncbi:MAG: type II secretion system protein N [Undibacterium sp.]|uniref:type II secretion system protein N n=1 Tax=Undibacterium sp. TaxID=1914977 RepID=UPI00272775D1|nr:type II secretion system protein N [Undibacterium sp.]MDO8653636.1 type II secretion system protein N [Undibacterium sp.]
MKRLPLLFSFFMFILMCMSLSYWGMQVFKPKVRAVVAPVIFAAFEPGIGQWGAVFGRSPITQIAASNYQLKGVIVAAKQGDSAAILSVDGKPEQTMAIDKELSKGVTLKEVHETYILISESGISKRVDLPQTSSLPASVPIVPAKKYAASSTNPIMPTAPVSSAASDNSR